MNSSTDPTVKDAIRSSNTNSAYSRVDLNNNEKKLKYTESTYINDETNQNGEGEGKREGGEENGKGGKGIKMPWLNCDCLNEMKTS